LSRKPFSRQRPPRSPSIWSPASPRSWTTRLRRDLYASPWFRKARAHVERTGAPWLILSAKHGLIAPSAVIEPYDVTLGAMGAGARRLWGARVLDELARAVDARAPLIVLAGRTYRDPLWPSIAQRASVPMEGMGIGEQLAWLTREA